MEATYMTKLTLTFFLARNFVRPAEPVDQINKKMQNKANLMHFWAVNDDSSQKQTQTNPIQTHFQHPCDTPNPKQTQSNPISSPPPARGFETFAGMTKGWVYNFSKVELGADKGKRGIQACL